MRALNDAYWIAKEKNKNIRLRSTEVNRVLFFGCSLINIP